MTKNLYTFLLGTLIALPVMQAQAEIKSYQPVSCSKYSEYAATNDECYIGGTVYVGYGVPKLLLNYTNKNQVPYFLFEKEMPWDKEKKPLEIATRTLQGDTWYAPNWNNNNNYTWHLFTLKGKDYYAQKIDPNETKEVVKAESGYALQFVKLTLFSTLSI